MPVQHPGNQRGRYQIVLHAAIVRPQNSFRPNARTTPPSRVRESRKPMGRSYSRHPMSGPAAENSRSGLEPGPGPILAVLGYDGLPGRSWPASLSWHARRGACRARLGERRPRLIPSPSESADCALASSVGQLALRCPRRARMRSDFGQVASRGQSWQAHPGRTEVIAQWPLSLHHHQAD